MIYQDGGANITTSPALFVYICDLPYQDGGVNRGTRLGFRCAGSLVRRFVGDGILGGGNLVLCEARKENWVNIFNTYKTYGGMIQARWRLACEACFLQALATVPARQKLLRRESVIRQCFDLHARDVLESLEARRVVHGLVGSRSRDFLGGNASTGHLLHRIPGSSQVVGTSTSCNRILRRLAIALHGFDGFHQRVITHGRHRRCAHSIGWGRGGGGGGGCGGGCGARVAQDRALLVHGHSRALVVAVHDLVLCRAYSGVAFAVARCGGRRGGRR